MFDTAGNGARMLSALAVGVTGIIGAAINAKYGYDLGINKVEKYLFMSGSVAVDVIKISTLGFAFYHMTRKAWSKMIICFMVWALAASWGMITATGVVATSRNILKSERRADTAEFKRDEFDYKLAENRILDLKKSDIWVKSQACLKVEGLKKADNEKCEMYWKDVGTLRDLKNVMRGGADKDDDPQATLLVWLAEKAHIQITREAMANIIIIFFAFMMEFVASVGMYGISKSRIPTKTFSTEDGAILNRDGSVRQKPGRKPRLVSDNTSAA